MKKELYLYNVQIRKKSLNNLGSYRLEELDNMLFKEKMFIGQIFEYNARVYEVMSINFNVMTVCDLTKNMKIGYSFNHDI